MSFRSAGFFKRDALLISSVGKLTADFIAIINFGRQESHLQSTQYEPRGHAQNKQPTISRDRRPVFRVVAKRSLTSFGGPRLTLNIVIKVIIIGCICLNMWRQVNLMMLALKWGPESLQKLVIRPDYCAGESGIPSENLGCSG